MSEEKFVAYYRVSTDRQGQSGLGLEAQKQAVTCFIKGNGNTLIREFTEIESGKTAKNRPQLLSAMKLCKKEKATLIIAKLDRLARNVHFISGLMESKIPFVAVDNPHATPLTIHILAAVAEDERKRISQRTKEALAAAKAKGKKLGVHGKALGLINHMNADALAKKLIPTIHDILSMRPLSIRALADELNRKGIPSPRGLQWHVPTVWGLLKRIARIKRTSIDKYRRQYKGKGQT